MYSSMAEHERTIFVTRHGNRLDWITPGWAKSVSNPADSPLAPSGEQQAMELAQSLRDSKITHIFCSPYTRTLQTANAVAELLDLKICVEFGMFEWHGSHSADFPKAEESSKNFPRIDLSHKSILPFDAIKQPESAIHFHQRVQLFVLELQKVLESRPEIKRPLFVGHAASANALLRYLTNDPEMNPVISTCSLSKMIPNGNGNGNSSRWKIESVNRCDHLTTGDENGWRFPDSHMKEVEAVVKLK